MPAFLAARRILTLSTGVGAFTLTLNGQPITLNSQRITLTKAA